MDVPSTLAALCNPCYPSRSAPLTLHDAFPQRTEISVPREKPDVVDPVVDTMAEGRESRRMQRVNKALIAILEQAKGDNLYHTKKMGETTLI